MKIQKNTFIYMLLIFAIVPFALAFLPFAATIIVACIFALGISYWLENVYVKLTKPKRRLVMISILVGAFLLLGTTISASTRLYSLTLGDDREETLQTFQTAKTKILAQLEASRLSLQYVGLSLPPIKEENIRKDWSKFAQSNIGSTLSWMGNYFTAMTDVFVNALVFIVFVVILVRRRARIMEVLSDTSLWGDLRVRSIYIKAEQSSYGSVFTIFSVGLVQTIIMTIGAAVAGYDELSIIFIATFFASFFPVLGTAPVGLFLSAIGFFQGDSRSGFIMLFIAGIVGVVDNWLKPYLVSHTGPKMNGFFALVGIVGAVIIFGISGLFIGPFLMIFIPSLRKEAGQLLRSMTTAEKLPAIIVEKSSN